MYVPRKTLPNHPTIFLGCLALAGLVGNVLASSRLDTSHWKDLQDKLEFGSLHSALPSLLEFRQETAMEVPRAGKGSIEFLIALGYL